MASILGFDPSLTLNNPIDREFRSAMASSIQQLGKNVQEGIKRIQTNRQVRDMTGELQSIDPQSETFPQEMMGVIERYPLALEDKRGAFGLSMLGAQHKQWLTQRAKVANEMPYISRDKSGNIVGINKRTGEPVFEYENNLPKDPILRSGPGGSTEALSQDPNDPNNFLVKNVIPGREAPVRPRQTRTMPNGVVEEFDPETNAWGAITSVNNKPKPVNDSAPTKILTAQKTTSDALKEQVKVYQKQVEDLEGKADAFLNSDNEKLAAQEPAIRDAANNLKKQLKDTQRRYEASVKELENMNAKFGASINRMGSAAIPGAAPEAQNPLLTDQSQIPAPGTQPSPIRRLNPGTRRFE